MTKGEFYERLTFDDLGQSWEIDYDLIYVSPSRQYGKTAAVNFWDILDDYHQRKECEKVEPQIDPDEFEAFLLEE